MRVWRKKGQSVLEYVLILAAVIAAAIAGAALLRGRLNTGFNNAGNVVEQSTNDFSGLYGNMNVQAP